MNNKILILFLFLVLTTTSCGETKKDKLVNNKDSQQVDNDIKKNTLLFPAKENSIFEITKDINLEGNTYIVPKGVTLVARGGLIENGTLIGDKTSIANNRCIFNNVTIEGTWNVKYISTELFKDIKKNNSLKSLFALASDNVDNTIFIEEGNYQVSATQKIQKVLRVPSRTKVIINGTISLAPNNLTNYYILYLNGDNIHIHGRGSIVGDKFTHKGTTGEWGMGIDLYQCSNVIISDLTIKNCWGDCIYVGGESRNVRINNCLLDNGRRQGISITSGSNIQIDNCIITNVAGTAPQYAIDVEPNKGDAVSDVKIENVKAVNCVGGYLVYGKAKNAIIKNVSIKGSSVIGAKAKYPVNVMCAKNVSIIANTIESNSDYSVLAQEIDGLTANDNKFRAKGNKPLNIISCKRKNIGKNETK